MNLPRIPDLLASSPVDRTAHLDPDRVRRYAELLDDLSPVVAFGTEQGLLLADGTIEAPPPRLAGSTSSTPRSDTDPRTMPCDRP